jgi:transcriptional regulator with XRE-family HTH domain
VRRVVDPEVSMARPLGDRQLRNQEVQSRLYGAPLGEVLDDLTAAFGVSRGAIAAALGLSAPMLSQLASGHRVKIGNPSAVHRLQRLVAALPDIRAGRLDAAEALRSVEAEEPGQVLTRTSQLVRRRGAADVQQVLRSAASAEELTEAAALLDERFPDLAEVLRVYGTGRNEEALTHYERVVPR